MEGPRMVAARMGCAPGAVKHAFAIGIVVEFQVEQLINPGIHPARSMVQARAGRRWIRSSRRLGSGHSETTRNNWMNHSKTHKKIVFSVLLGVAITPAAFAQVLGGAVNVGGGIGAQTGPLSVGGDARLGADVGLRTDAVRETTRRARNAATRAEAEARAAANAGLQAAASA